MAITKTIEIDGKEVTFRASAALPRMYRIRFGRDIYADFNHIMKEMDAQKEQDTQIDDQDVQETDEKTVEVNMSSMSTFDLEMFENIAWLMAKHADKDKGEVPNNPDDWLEEFNMFSIYEILPTIVELWGLNVKRDVEAKKNMRQVSGK